MKRRLPARAFILFEAMLATFIFSLALLALGRSVENCLRAEMLKDEDSRARRVLISRMAEIEAQAIFLDDKEKTEELKEPYAGMTLKMRREPLQRKNEKDQEIVGIFTVTLDLAWKSHGAVQTRQLQFYVYPRQN